MANTSATGGVLLPASNPADDDALDTIIQANVSQLTGLAGANVRPRWQASVPKQPDPTVDWCAIGVLTAEPDADAWMALDPANPLQSLYYRHESIEYLASFYGPNSKKNSALLRDGLEIDQNREILAANAIAFVACGTLRAVPEFVNQQWIKRTDMTIDFRRKVTRTYQVLSLLYGSVVLTTDSGISATIVIPPGSVLQP